MNTEEARDAVLRADWKLGASDRDREVATGGTLLLTVVGSTVHGLAVRDGVEDLDVMGLCCEPPERALGMTPFHQWVGRTKAEGERSEAGASRGSVVNSVCIGRNSSRSTASTPSSPGTCYAWLTRESNI